LFPVNALVTPVNSIWRRNNTRNNEEQKENVLDSLRNE
jgi:hypothetical protein